MLLYLHKTDMQYILLSCVILYLACSTFLFFWVRIFIHDHVAALYAK